MPRFISLNLEYVFYQIYRFGKSFFDAGGLGAISGGADGSGAAGSSSGLGLLSIGAFALGPVLLFFLFLIILLLLWALTYLLLKIRRSHINHEWSLYEKAQESRAINESVENPKWKSVQLFTESENQSDWKIAIIEADKMLDDALQTSGAGGENLGDRLKNFDPKTTVWLDDAWDAHKVRNRIAHESDFEITKYETRKAVSKYEHALREMRAI